MPALGIADKIHEIKDRTGKTVETLGQAGAFGMAGSAIAHYGSPQVGRRITELQTVYDTYGPDATKHFLAATAVRSTMKRLPAAARKALNSSAGRMHQASPLIRGVLRLADVVRKI
jgi:hypothetical protein